MDGENNGKPYFLMDDLGGKPTIFGNIHIPTLGTAPFFPLVATTPFPAGAPKGIEVDAKQTVKVTHDPSMGRCFRYIYRSMNGLFLMVNVGNYTSPMDGMA